MYTRIFRFLVYTLFLYYFVTCNLIHFIRNRLPIYYFTVYVYYVCKSFPTKKDDYSNVYHIDQPILIDAICTIHRTVPFLLILVDVEINYNQTTELEVYYYT